MSRQGRTIVALSGGVDSAVAALLLLDAGREVEALFMSNWEEDEDGYCTSAADFQDARRICAELGIPLHKVSFAKEYREQVFAHFLSELKAGRTPNPDVLCNREIKFGSGLAYARRLGARALRHGPLCAHRTGPAAVARTGCRQGPELFPARARRVAARGLRISDRPPAEERGAGHRARPRAAGRRQARLDRHLLHRRAAVRRVHRRVAAGTGRADRDAGWRGRRPARRSRALHAGPAQRARRRRPARARRGALVRRRQGPRAQCAGRGPGRGSSGAPLQRPARRRAALDFGRGARPGLRLHRQGALPPARRALPRQPRRRRRGGPLRRSGSGRGARPVRGVL